MDVFRFFLGSGWMMSWYLVFYTLGVLPSLLFLGYFRRSRVFGPGDGLALTYSIGSTWLVLLTAIDGFLLARGMHGTNILKYPEAILGLLGVFGIYQVFATRCILRDLFDRRHSWAVHGFLFLLVFLNLYSLWIFQNRHLLSL